MRSHVAPFVLLADNRHLIMLGLAARLHRKAGGGLGDRVYKFDRGSSGLFVTPDKRILFVLPIEHIDEISGGRRISGFKKHKKVFRDWSAFNVNNAYRIKIDDRLGRLSQSGSCGSIQYVSDKWTGEDQLYQHDFEEPALLYSAGPKKAPAAFAVKSRKNKALISTAGIIG